MIHERYKSVNSFSKIIDVSEGTVRNWISGRSEPSLSDIVRLCEVLETDPKWLMTGIQETPNLSYTLSSPKPSIRNLESSYPASEASKIRFNPALGRLVLKLVDEIDELDEQARNKLVEKVHNHLVAMDCRKPPEEEMIRQFIQLIRWIENSNASDAWF